jgi:nitrogen fixation NifU-like protein
VNDFLEKIVIPLLLIAIPWKIMNEIQALYQQMILDHNKNPRNFAEMEDPTHSSEGHNPLCGDEVTIYMKIHEGIIEDITFKGSGCAISTSSASIMTTVLKGRTLEEAEQFFNQFHGIVTASMDTHINSDELGKLAVFTGVREFPARVKCASLAWHTMSNAMRGNGPVSTE